MDTNSSSAGKKRKISHDEEEEEKMEKFYALIKTIREARDHFIINSNKKEQAAADVHDHDLSKTDQKKQKLEDHQEKQVVVCSWKPSFQRGDFMELDQNHHDDHDQLKKKPHFPVPVITLASTSESKEGITDNSKQQEVKEELDLNLSL